MASEVELVRVEPALGTTTQVFMHEAVTVSADLRSSFPIQLLRPQLWTNTTHKLNPEGKWHGLDMVFQNKSSENGALHFLVSFLTTDQGEFEYTVRIGIRKLASNFENKDKYGRKIHHSTSTDDDNIVEWKWAGSYGQNGKIQVLPPNENMPWTKGPQYIEIAPQVWVGNFMAASQAHELGFDSVLCVAAELDIAPTNGMKYKKIFIGDGAHNVVPEVDVKEAIRWIDQRVKEGSKVLIFCRAGIGRSGSIGISYLYYLHPELSFKQILEEIWKLRTDFYPHQGLEASLEKLFPRKGEKQKKEKPLKI